MRPAVVAAFAMLICAGAASARDLGGEAQSAISAYRQQHGLPAVRADARLMALAQQQANAMARAGVLDHSVGGAFQSRIASYDPARAAENIAMGTRDFAATLALWKNSSEHNANLLMTGATRIGIASANSASRYRIFWALILAQPDTGPRGRRPPMLGAPGGPPKRARPAQ